LRSISPKNAVEGRSKSACVSLVAHLLAAGATQLQAVSDLGAAEG